MRVLALAILLLAPAATGSGTAEQATMEPLILPAPPVWAAPEPYTALVASAAFEADIPIEILGRLLEAESDWNPVAAGVNADGSRDLGIAQLGERWLADFVWFDNDGQVFDPFDPAEAIPIAARYLARLYRATGDWRAAVAAYNCGLSRVRSGEIPARTRAYVAAILQGEYR